MKKIAIVVNNLISNIAVWDEVSTWDYPKCEIVGYKRMGDAVHFRNNQTYTHNIVIDGNSMAVGDSGGEVKATETSVTDAGLTSYDYINMAFNGATVTDLTSVAGARVDPLYETDLGTKNILVFWEGINEITAGKTDVQCYNNIKAYCTARKLKGWKIIVGTLTPRNGGAGGGNQETYRLSVNTMIRNAKIAEETWLDEVADVGGDATIGTSVNATYYADGIHLTPAGHTIAKTYFTAAINLLK